MSFAYLDHISLYVAGLKAGRPKEGLRLDLWQLASRSTASGSSCFEEEQFPCLWIEFNSLFQNDSLHCDFRLLLSNSQKEQMQSVGAKAMFGVQFVFLYKAAGQS